MVMKEERETQAIELNPNPGPANASIIWLHGLGADGQDFAKLKFKILAIKGDWNLSADQNTLSFQNLNIESQYKTNLIRVAGNITVHHLKQNPSIQVEFSSKDLNINALFQKEREISGQNATKQNAAIPIPNFKNCELAFKYENPALEVTRLKVSLENQGVLDGKLKLVLDERFSLDNLKGNFHAKDFSLNLLKVAELSSDVKFENRVLSFAPIVLRTEKGSHQGSLEVDFHEASPKFTLHHQSEGFEVAEWKNLFPEAGIIEGFARMKTNMNAYGHNFSQITDSLSGESEFVLGSGKIQGFDLIHASDHIQNTVKIVSDTILKKEPVQILSLLTGELEEWKKRGDKNHNLSTPFETAQGKIIFNNGVVENNDFILTHIKYRMEGKGKLDLKSKNLDYSLATWLNTPVQTEVPELMSYLKEKPFTFQLQGPWGTTTLKPHFGNYTQDAIAVIEKHLKSIAEKEAKASKNVSAKKIKAKGKANPETTKATTTTPPTTTPVINQETSHLIQLQ
jgi:uncharacterized protein involved in outer membrane biogenesis